MRPRNAEVVTLTLLFTTIAVGLVFLWRFSVPLAIAAGVSLLLIVKARSR